MTLQVDRWVKLYREGYILRRDYLDGLVSGFATGDLDAILAALTEDHLTREFLQLVKVARDRGTLNPEQARLAEGMDL